MAQNPRKTRLPRLSLREARTKTLVKTNCPNSASGLWAGSAAAWPRGNANSRLSSLYELGPRSNFALKPDYGQSASPRRNAKLENDLAWQWDFCTAPTEPPPVWCERGATHMLFVPCALQPLSRILSSEAIWCRRNVRCPDSQEELRFVPAWRSIFSPRLKHRARRGKKEERKRARHRAWFRRFGRYT